MSEQHKPTHEFTSPIEKSVAEYASEFGVSQLEPIAAQPPYQVYKADHYVFKAYVPEDAQKELTSIEERIRTIHQLRDSGAAVMEFITGPQLRGDVLITTSPFYPDKIPPTPEGYALMGHAVASLHNAGWQQTEDFKDLQPLNPLSAIWKTFHYLESKEAEGSPFKIGDAVFPRHALQLLEERLVYAQAAFDEMMKRAAESNHLTTVCRDVHPGNFLLDTEANPRIIDLMDNLAIGPPEYDLARPSAHWVERIGRSPQARNAFLEGYNETLRPDIHIDQQLLQLAIKVSDTYYAVSMLKNAVNASERGNPSSDEWRISEVVNRLTSLEDPTHRWQSFIDYTK